MLLGEVFAKPLPSNRVNNVEPEKNKRDATVYTVEVKYFMWDFNWLLFYKGCTCFQCKILSCNMEICAVKFV